MRFSLVVTSLFLFNGISNAKPKIVYYGVANETNLPFVEVDNSKGYSQISGGILKKLAEALSKELGLNSSLVLLPQKRVGPDLEAGDLSLVCFVHENWFPKEFTAKLLWSDALATNTNLIATAKQKPVSKIEDLYGKQVGTIVNYFYKTLDPYFEKNKIIRETGPSTSSNIQKLIHGRIDYMIISNMEFNFYKKKYPQLQAYDLKMDILNVKCALSKKADIDIEDLNQAIANLKKTGALDKILKP